MEEKSKKTVSAALGRRLSALISQAAVPISFNDQPSKESLSKESGKILEIKPRIENHSNSEVHYLSIDKVSNNPSQPRQEFKETELIELAASIKKLGVLQPIVARRLHNDVLEIVAGERRWRAARLAGLNVVPV